VSILNPLFEAVAWVLIKIHAGLAVPFGPDSGLTWVLSIVILVVLMRLIMLPLFIKQVKSQQRMQAHMPQMRELQKRYKHDKQRQQEEMMKFYKENGINPLGGCLPLVAQLPVFWSLFNVLKAIAEWKPNTAPLYGIPVSVVQSALHARVFGATLADKVLFTGTLHVPLTSKLVILVAVIISATTTFLTMRQSQKRGMMQQPMQDPDNPAANMQKYMMYLAPLFALSGLYWQFGLVIYWVTTNVWTLGQQHFLFRNLPVISANADSATAPASGAKGAAAAKGAPAKASAAKASASAKNGTVSAKNGTAAAKNGTAAGTGTAKTGTAKTGTAAKTSTAAKAGTATGKTGTAGKAVPAGKSSAGNASSNGSSATRAATRETVQDTSGGNGARKLLGFGKGKAEPEPEPVEQPKIVRQQPVRQTRSKRSGKR
jgi:YidC/Oxa1 family membrane protein insertase